jgi:hypothetical protein
MTIRSLRARLERLEAQAPYVIGQDPERDRKRWEELRSRSYHPGLSKEEAAEKAKLEASFVGENRGGRAPYELLYKHLCGTLTPEEEIEYAKQEEGDLSHLSPKDKELVQMLRAIAREGTNHIGTGDQGRAANSKPNDSLAQKQLGSAIKADEKLPPAALEITSDAELLKQLQLAANHNLVPGEGIENVRPIRAMLECGIKFDDVYYTLRAKVDPRVNPKNKRLASWSDHVFIRGVAETYGRRVMLPIIKEKLRARSGNEGERS